VIVKPKLDSSLVQGVGKIGYKIALAGPPREYLLQ
jgi:hypothetical protein